MQSCLNCSPDKLPYGVISQHMLHQKSWSNHFTEPDNKYLFILSHHNFNHICHYATFTSYEQQKG